MACRDEYNLIGALIKRDRFHSEKVMILPSANEVTMINFDLIHRTDSKGNHLVYASSLSVGPYPPPPPPPQSLCLQNVFL